ncbi:MAG: pyruvate synthase subunit beta [Planctomycetes bacterium]|nr:pyruvate synthase subunit beta [Planctomycetota bacterium]
MSTKTATHGAAAGAPVCGVENSLLRPGNTNCGGCGLSIVLSMIGRALDRAGKQTRMVIPACCGIVTAGGYPTSSYGSPVLGATFGGSPAFATGVAAVGDLNGEQDYVVINLAGDGGTYDIGMATLSAAAERNENFIYFCYDNEIYGNTGGQRSSATPVGAKTTTTPYGETVPKKDILSIMVAHRIPYAATLSIAHPEDFERKMLTAIRTRGFRFLLAHSPCPTGWKSEPSQTVQLVRIAVNSGLFALYEVFDGRRYRVNVSPDGSDPETYYGQQRRFPRDAVDFQVVRAEVGNAATRLAKLAEIWPARDDE